MGMRSPDNTVQAVLDLYALDLAPLYPSSEIRAIAAIVFQERLAWDRTELSLRRSERLSESELLLVYKPLKRLRQGEPLQYVLGHVRFHGLRIEVAPGVLIPRPETEEMVERAIRSTGPLRSALDIGTGSGAIALALKHAFPEAKVTAMDVSSEALAQARRNGERLGLPVEWMLADVLDPELVLPPADLVISNPPYVLRSEADGLDAHVGGYEPELALFVEDKDPLLFHRTIARKALQVLRPGGHLWLEGHRDHISGLAPELRGMGYDSVEPLSDLSGLDRFIHAIR